MKKLLVTTLVAAACGLCALQPTPARAQSANFTLSLASGSLLPGSSFTLSLSLNFTSGGNIQNLAGLSYWLQTQNSNPPFYFALTNRDLSGSQFTDPQTPGITYPQSLQPDNANDLGALLPVGATPLASGFYPIAQLTFSISAMATPGNYVIQTIAGGPKNGVMNDSDGDTLSIPSQSFSVNVVPEPGTLTLAVVAALTAGVVGCRRRRTMS